MRDNRHIRGIDRMVPEIHQQNHRHWIPKSADNANPERLGMALQTPCPTVPHPTCFWFHSLNRCYRYNGCTSFLGIQQSSPTGDFASNQHQLHTAVLPLRTPNGICRFLPLADKRPKNALRLDCGNVALKGTHHRQPIKRVAKPTVSIYTFLAVSVR